MNLNNLSNLVQDELENILSDIINSDNINDFLQRYQTINNDTNIISENIRDTSYNQTMESANENNSAFRIPISNIRRSIPQVNNTNNNSQTNRPTNNFNQQNQTNHNNNRRNNNNNNNDNRTNFGELYDTLYQLNMNMHEYNMNYRDYQRNIENILNIITEENRRNYAPRQNHSNEMNGFDVGRNVSYFLYEPLRRNTTRVNTSSLIPLSPEMIRLSTRIIPYNISFSEPRCPITLEDFIVGEQIMQIIPCGHIFKSDALTNWFRRDNKCPCCRFDISTFIIHGVENTRRNMTRHNSITSDIHPNENIDTNNNMSDEIAIEIEVEISSPSDNITLP